MYRSVRVCVQCTCIYLFVYLRVMHKRFSLRFRNVYWESSCEITGNNWKEPIFYLFSFFSRKSIESVVGNHIFYEFSFFSRFKSIFVFFLYIFSEFFYECVPLFVLPMVLYYVLDVDNDLFLIVIFSTIHYANITTKQCILYTQVEMRYDF